MSIANLTENHDNLPGTDNGAPGTVAAVQRSNQPLRTYVDVLQPARGPNGEERVKLKLRVCPVVSRPPREWKFAQNPGGMMIE